MGGGDGEGTHSARCYIRDPYGVVFNIEEKSDSA
jgi:hypothetical protein